MTLPFPGTGWTKKKPCPSVLPHAMWAEGIDLFNNGCQNQRTQFTLHGSTELDFLPTLTPHAQFLPTSLASCSTLIYVDIHQQQLAKHFQIPKV